MALSRIWAAFIIAAIGVALFRYSFSADKDIFSRMVVGRADDVYETTRYMMIGSPEKAGYTSKADYSGFLAGYGFQATDSVNQANILVADNVASDSVAILRRLNPSLQVYTYRSIQ